MSRPEKYWHCALLGIGRKKHCVANDLDFAVLQRQIIEPWHGNIPFPVSGFIVSSRDHGEGIRITHTYRDLDWFIAEKNAGDRARGIMDMSTHRAMLPI